ncbi:hypothetical protein C7212DRAFT_309861 [Tuber magnatum]|uniref:Uncharacterized protein n=1 Tax=Tuber magnatum TaxID=42249 RepID=A0A317SX47_9PEZI|nr:hypothetical protein C7212DRAFT_309861 [Tuber magnatum]
MISGFPAPDSGCLSALLSTGAARRSRKQAPRHRKSDSHEGVRNDHSRAGIIVRQNSPKFSPKYKYIPSHRTRKNGKLSDLTRHI